MVTVSADPLALPSAPEAEPSTPPDRGLRHVLLRPLPLLVILALQAILSARLVASNSAFTDEALYLWAGRLEWLHLLDGRHIPPFATYFSGAPVLYPPVAALADALGGLEGARILSLVFMLGATALLWATTLRLFDRIAAWFAAASWALIGPTLFLGALATFDAMSLCLLAGAVYCLTRAAGRLNFVGWTVAAAAALTLANASCYSTIIFDPFVILLALLVQWPLPSKRVAAMRTVAFGSYMLTAVALLVAGGRTYYWTGLDRTVLARAAGISPTSAVASSSWQWIGTVVVAAALAVVVGCLVERRGSVRLLLAVLMVAGLIVPLEQARLHTTTSLDKHVDMGAWFAAIAVGYLASRIVSLPRRRLGQMCLGVCLIVVVALPVRRAVVQAREMHSWPNSAAFVAALRPLTERFPGPLLVETPSPVRYALERSVTWQRWSDTYNITKPDGKSEGSSSAISAAGDPAIFNRLVRRGYFSVIALYGYATPALDRQIERDISQTPRYAYVATVPYGGAHYTIWRLRNDSQ